MKRSLARIAFAVVLAAACGGCAGAGPSSAAPAASPRLTSAPAPSPARASTDTARPTPPARAAVAPASRVTSAPAPTNFTPSTRDRFKLANDSDMNAAARTSQASQQALSESLK